MKNKKVLKYTYKLIVLKKLLSCITTYKKTGNVKIKLHYNEIELNRNCGICENLRIISYEMFGTEKYAEINKYFKTWKHFSGDDLYPISSIKNTTSQYSSGCYIKNTISPYSACYYELYDDKHNYKARVSLLKHCINCVELELENEIFL